MSDDFISNNDVSDSDVKENNSHFSFQRIGIIHSCFKEKFGTPRQPGLVPAARARLQLLPPYNRKESLVGIEGFSHLWIHFVFHQCWREDWKPMVRPPRLGGKEKIGVFASRSTFRPNPIGLSVVELLAVEHEETSGNLSLLLKGADLIDGTPVLDIKPYIEYSDRIDNTKAGYASAAPDKLPVRLSPAAEIFCKDYENQRNETQRNGHFRELIVQVLQLDPRPEHYKDSLPDRVYSVVLQGCEVKWLYNQESNEIMVTAIDLA